MNLRTGVAAGLLLATSVAVLGAQGVTPFDTLKARTLLERSLPCLGCHALGGSGGRLAPDLATVRERRSAQYIAAMIDDPQRVVPGSAMPRTPLSASTRGLLVRYLARVGIGPVTTGEAVPQRAASADGAALYARWCAACHGPQGGGDGVNARYLPVRPAVHRDARLFSLRSDDQLYDAIAAGGAAMGRSARMPAFGATLTPSELRALVAHIRVLCRCRAPSWSASPNEAPPTR
jgi:mono/diheme cytochrome c family protein